MVRRQTHSNSPISNLKEWDSVKNGHLTQWRMGVCKAIHLRKKKAEDWDGSRSLASGPGRRGCEPQLLCHGITSLSSLPGSVLGLAGHPASWALNSAASELTPSSSSAVWRVHRCSETVLTYHCYQATYLGDNILREQFLLGFSMDKSCFLMYSLLPLQ